MNIEDVKRITELVKEVNCSGSALVSEVAREMGVKKTALMQFINDNPKLFRVGELQQRNGKGWVKTVGMAITHVYLAPEGNPDTQEWLELKRKEWDRKIHVAGWNYYGGIEFWYIPEESKDSKERLYRNTPEKLRQLEELGAIKKSKVGYGALWDFNSTSQYVYSDSMETALQKIGWTTDFVKE